MNMLLMLLPPCNAITGMQSKLEQILLEFVVAAPAKKFDILRSARELTIFFDAAQTF